MVGGGLMDIILGLGFIWQIKGHDYNLVLMATLRDSMTNLVSQSLVEKIISLKV